MDYRDNRQTTRKGGPYCTPTWGPGSTPIYTGRPASPFTRADVLREPIFYGGESAYSFQYRDMVLERYAADEVWLRANKGFSIADAQAIAEAISDVQTEKIVAALSRLKAELPSFPSLLPAFTNTAEEIAAHCGRSVETAQSVLAALSATAPCNQDFRSLGAFNLANACPIIALPDGRYIALQTYAIVESLYDSPFYWMVGDKAYRAKPQRIAGPLPSSLSPSGCARSSGSSMSTAT